MLSKISDYNFKYGTGKIIKFIKDNPNILIDKIQDNLKGLLLIKLKNENIIIYNYNNNKYYNHNRIQIYFNNKIFIKHIDSFDQNNINISSQIRKYTLKLILSYEIKFNTIIGIGGEYYMYWLFITKIKNLIGISNHQTIIDDAQINVPYSNNYLVNYNILNTYPKIIFADIILLNVFQINNNIIKYIFNIIFNKLIIISCNLPDTKLKFINKYFKIIKIKYFKNINNFIRIIELEKKI